LPERPGINGPDDYIAANSGEMLLRLIEDEVTFSQLAQMRPADYDRARKAAAKKRGITTAALDAEVAVRRAMHRETYPGNGQGRTPAEPRPHLVDGEQGERATIVLQPGRYPEATDEAEQVLLSHVKRLRIFQRGGEVVRIISLKNEEQSSGLRREPGAVMLVSVSAVALTEMLDRLAVWQRVSETEAGQKARRVDCPGRIASAYLSRIGSWRLPHLTGIVTAPILRSDGTVLHRAGYDQQTGLLLTEEWLELCGEPTQEDALAALRDLEAPFSEFPFISPEDRSVLIAGILTALQRRLLASAPLFGFTAPVQRTGKSLLAECVAIIATGRPAPAMAVPADREEIRKAVAAALREGHAIVNLDNIEHPLGSPDLSRAITQSEYADRLLGETRILRLPTNLLWTATGNNLTFRGDLAVRALLCRLDAKRERPEERQFKIADLQTHILEHRRELIAAAMTILRAYVTAGAPDQGLKPWGGFDEWSAAVRAPLAWLGMPDPCNTRRHVIQDDPDREHAAAILSSWHSAFGDKAVLIANVIERAGSDASLNSALLSVAASKSHPDQLDPRRLAWWCREWRGRVVENFRLDRSRDYGDRAMWLVEASTVSAVNTVTLGQENPGRPTDQGRESTFCRENNRSDRNDRKIDKPKGFFEDDVVRL
jgi:putative DNA primase/helicase